MKDGKGLNLRGKALALAFFKTEIQNCIQILALLVPLCLSFQLPLSSNQNKNPEGYLFPEYSFSKSDS